VRNPVSTRKLKFDGTVKSSWDGDLVDASDDGWLAVFYERPEHRIGGQAVVYALRYFSTRLPLSILVSFDEGGGVLEYQCDAALPATVDGRTVDMIDLDLDVMASASLEYFVRDQERFEQNRGTMGYTREAAEAAHEGVRGAIELIVAGAFPFDGSAERLLGRVLASQGPV
jgi:uncharacterized protein